MPPKWERYKLGKKSSKDNYTNQDHQPLEKLYHVAHLPTALRILEDGKLRAGLIGDKSILRDSRTLVNWVSPNTWVNGYRYGSICFEFDVNSLLRRRKIYWVETIGYNIPACRLLLTNEVHDDLSLYDPESDNGPIYRDDDGNYWWNGKVCVELMIEDDIHLAKLDKISFVKHNPNMCCLDHATCQEKTKSSDLIGAKFIAAVVSNGLDFDDKWITKVTKRGVSFNDSIITATDKYHTALNKGSKWFGTMTSTSVNAQTFAKAALHFFAKGKLDDYRIAAGIFQNKNHFLAALTDLLMAHFNVTYGNDILQFE